MTADPILDPRTGRMISVYDLARQTGLPAHIVWYRYEQLGIRSMTLIAPKGTPIDIEQEKARAHRLWLASTAGLLTTAPRLGDYARMRQRQQGAAA